jgi:hypothetical protein
MAIIAESEKIACEACLFEKITIKSKEFKTGSK